ncbi:MAG: hypothetical protein ABFR97_05240 [Thermodesulfobacteriota bacterium]
MQRIEFAGLPGVGKTSVRRELVRSLQALSGANRYLTAEEAVLCVARKHIDKIYRYLLLALPNRIALKLSTYLFGRSLLRFGSQNTFLANWGEGLESFLASGQYSDLSVADRENVIAGFLETGSVFEVISREFVRDEIVFFEEGFVQKSFMFLSHGDKFSSFPVDNVSRYLDSVPLPDVLVHVTSDIDTCYNRMISRPDGLTSRLSRCDENEIRQFLSRAERHLSKVTELLAKDKSVEIINVDNSMDFSSTVSDLYRRIIYQI